MKAAPPINDQRRRRLDLFTAHVKKTWLSHSPRKSIEEKFFIAVIREI